MCYVLFGECLLMHFEVSSTENLQIKLLLLVFLYLDTLSSTISDFAFTFCSIFKDNSWDNPKCKCLRE